MASRPTKHQIEDLIFDIIAFRSILFKMEFDEAASNECLFVEMLNEVGFRTPTGKEFTLMGYRQMMKRADQGKIRVMVDRLIHDPVVVNFQI